MLNIYIFLGFQKGFPYTMTDFTPFEFIKIYIGQLPLAFEEAQLIKILEPMAELKEVKIMKGDNTRGKFDLFCYAFVTMRGNQSFGHEIIRRLHQRFPTWKMNLKHDLDRRKAPMNQMYPHQNQPMPYQRPNPSYQNYPPITRGPYPNYQPMPTQNLTPNNSAGLSEKIIGQKPCNILVRELWLGGIPQHFNKISMAQLMSHYGVIDEIQIFPKFAFIKYKQVTEATAAFERAEEIFQRLGNPPGFRIFFSDPSRRAYIVSNNYEYEKQSIHVPIVFIGFPPVTSATVEMQSIKPVVQKIAPVKAEYMRKSTNAQNRSYFMFSFDSVKTSIRVKQQLNKRKELLGDKRAEIYVLIDQQAIMKGRDFSYTLKMFQGEDFNKNRKNMNYNNNDNNMKHAMMPMNMGYPPMYQNPMYPPMNSYPSYFPPQPYYYEPGYYNPPVQGQMHQNTQPVQKPIETDNSFHDFLKDVLADKDSGNEKKPRKSSQIGNQEDILSKLLGNEATKPKVGQDKSEASHTKQEKVKQRLDDREPSWSGFLTWKGSKRVGVDGYSNNVQLEDYAINIVSLIQFKDLILKDKNILVLSPSNNIGGLVFKDYIKNLRNKAGVAFNSQFLIYVMAKSPDCDKIAHIEDDELLVVLQKASFLTQIKDKLIKSEELA